ncbi:MAG: DUF4760 domain-containing protein [Rhodospirillales bacterium]
MLILTTLLAAFVAIIVVAQHRLVAKKRATLDFISVLYSDNLVQKERVFLRLAEEGGLEEVLGPSSLHIESRQQVESYLNHWEMFAASIRGHIFDEDICKLILGDKVCKQWDKAEPLITKIREKEGKADKPDNEFFEHFENLAREWKANPKAPSGSQFKKLLREIVRF